jgi:ribonucleoside-diphosphate reductase alpha chain
MKSIKKFSTEMNQPKSILESIDSKALTELINGMGFKDIHELKKEKALLTKLEALLKEKGEDKDQWWDQMLAEDGSVQNLPDYVLSKEEKELFLTFPEINQLELIRQAAIRQRYLDQTQSLNLSFDPSDSPKWINQVHIEAWKLGIKTLYYLRTDSVIKGDLGSRQADCISCEA